MHSVQSSELDGCYAGACLCLTAFAPKCKDKIREAMQKLAVMECNESLIAQRHFADASAWLRLGRLEFKLVHFLRDVQPVGGVEIPL
ncbi:hypothetical protein ALC57_06929 [Trachymyrmex cornetzi]|uniref:Uncharacterized protein n=1 Tax=Trachymyrmex cornetzi TaxID=471704 RepID=A0A195E7E9_9HYME|nr:hypothetical protein ALC57_06929 [Trachymyrmex cornetzi]